MNKAVKFLFVLVFFLLSSAVHAQWEPSYDSMFVTNKIKPQCFAVKGNNLYLGCGAGLYVSTNNGYIWKRLFSTQSSEGIYSIMLKDDNINACTNYGLYISSDSGSNWNKKIIDTSVSKVASVVTLGDKIFTGTDGGVFMSGDNGKSWSKRDSGLIYTSAPGLIVNGDKLYTRVSPKGFFLSSDEGKYWYDISTGLQDRIISLYTGCSEYIVVRTAFTGIYRTSDDGSNWVNINIDSDIMKNKVRSFAATGTNLFADLHGIFLSTDCGSNWRNVSYNINDSASYTLFIADSLIYAGGSDGVIYRAKLSDFNIAAVPEKINTEYPKNLSIIVLNDVIRFAFEPNSGHYNFKIYDLFGNAVFSQSKAAESGINIIDLNKNDFYTGVYFCTLSSMNYFETKQFLIIR